LPEDVWQDGLLDGVEWKDQLTRIQKARSFGGRYFVMSWEAKRFGPAAGTENWLLHKGADRFIELPFPGFRRIT